MAEKLQADSDPTKRLHLSQHGGYPSSVRVSEGTAHVSQSVLCTKGMLEPTGQCLGQLVDRSIRRAIVTAMIRFVRFRNVIDLMVQMKKSAVRERTPESKKSIYVHDIGVLQGLKISQSA